MSDRKYQFRTVTVFGDRVTVKLSVDEDGRHHCEFSKQRNPDLRRDLQTFGAGDTVEAAIADYVRSCHQLADLTPGELYRD